MNIKLRLLWIIPHLFLYVLNIGMLTFIIWNWKDITAYGNPGFLTFVWVMFTMVQLFGSYKIIEWIRSGKM